MVAFDIQTVPYPYPSSALSSTSSSPYLPYSEEKERNPTKRSLNAGKWSMEEKLYANRLVFDFEAGLLEDCREGITLRSYLSTKLRCAPMRISKKFAKLCIGSKTFCRKVGDREHSQVCIPPFQLIDCSQPSHRIPKRKTETKYLEPRKRNQAFSKLNISSNMLSSQPSTFSRDCFVNSSISTLHSISSNLKDTLVKSVDNTLSDRYSPTFHSDDSESDSDVSEDPIDDSDEYYEWSNALSYFQSEPMTFPPYALFLEGVVSN